MMSPPSTAHRYAAAPLGVDADAADWQQVEPHLLRHDPAAFPADELEPRSPPSTMCSSAPLPFHRIEGDERLHALQRYEALVQGSVDAIIGKTLDGIVTSWNPAAERIFGYSAAEMLGQPMLRVFPPERVDEEQVLLERLARGERIEKFETVRRCKDGTDLHVCISLSPIRNAQGAVCGIAKIARDITERVLASQRINDLFLIAKRFEALVDSSDDAIVSKTLDGIVTSWNPAAERIFGYSAEEMIGAPMLCVFPDDRKDEERVLLERMARGERVDHFETVRRHRDGSKIHVSVSLSPVRDAQGAIVGVAKIARDITERVLQQQQREEAGRAAQRLAALVNSSDDAIIASTLDGTIASWNGSAARMFGWPAEAILGKNLELLCPPELRAREAAVMQRVAGGQRAESFETQQIRRDGSLLDVSITVSPIVDEGGRITGLSRIARDISDRLQAERTIWQQANFDSLTKLPNRSSLEERMRRELARAQRHQQRVAVMLVDLDHFKEVNDTLGHSVGDRLLVQAAERIKAGLRSIDSVARMGGDEFIVLLPDLNDATETIPIAKRLNERLAEPFLLDGQPVHISASIGIALYPDDGCSPEDLLKHADQAMYEAKRLGRNQLRHFAHVMEQTARDRLHLAGELRLALAERRLELAFQPVFDLRSGRIAKAEALLRWTHPELGPISPGRFIPLAEETGLIVELGDWVFQEALREARQWSDQVGRPMRVAVNVSPVQLGQPRGYFEAWRERLQEAPGLCDLLIVEITEGVMLEQRGETAANLALLREAGLMIAVDDFGTGYSNLANLTKLDVNLLKIDQSFVRPLQSDSREHALCDAIVAMAHRLGLQVVAEGVETPEQLTLLRSMGCDYAQGFLLARPAPATRLTELLRQDLPLAELAMTEVAA